MSSDDSKAPPDVAWRPAGIGMNVTFRCAKCDKYRNTGGSKWLMRGGVRQHWCKYCLEKH